MSDGDLVRPLEPFGNETLGVPTLTERDILRINRLFATSAGERAALDDPATGKLVCPQVPVNWLQPAFPWEGQS